MLWVLNPAGLTRHTGAAALTASMHRGLSSGLQQPLLCARVAAMRAHTA